MNSDILLKIREEVSRRLETLNKDNEYARRREEVENEEEVKKILGLPYNRSIGPVVKSEEDVIMDVYNMYAKEIEEHETHGIYVYDSSYVALDLSLEMIEEGYPLQKEVEYDDPRVTHRYYYNLEGLYVECVNVEDIEEFEKQNIVIYGVDYSKIQREFICDCVRSTQADAVSKVLKLK
ncbi:MAG: hypothetical protein IJ399_02325 [Bacilli bacterium]|nr:hypothetical protein [Bacilli bacterium]